MFQLPTNRLEQFLAKETGSQVRIVDARRLTGGASRDSWALDVEVADGEENGHHRLVLRRDAGGVIEPNALSREAEFRILNRAHAAGVKVPRPRWLCTDPDVIGAPFFLMDRLEGESVGRRVVREPGLSAARRQLPKQMAEQLACIHRVPVEAALEDGLARGDLDRSPAQFALQQAVDRLRQFDEPHPALELAVRWLEQHTPPCPRSVLVHGDFRIGNMIVDEQGLVGIIDWEFAHVGDPIEDLAWPCVRSWRFGQDHLRFGGIADAEEFIRAYERASGSQVDRNAVLFWEILGGFRWAVGCIAQAQRYLSGQEQSLELASLGRKTAEVELEVLRLIEEEVNRQ